MDVNTVLQNTRQYFQGVPTSSPASGELAPGASVGYNSPPVSSTATVTATSATNPYPPPFPPQPYPAAQPAAGVAWSAAANAHNAASVFHTSSAQTAASLVPSSAYSRGYPPPQPSTTMSAKYHSVYENAVRTSPKMLPSNPSMAPFVPPPHNYLQTPSVTRYCVFRL